MGRACERGGRACRLLRPTQRTHGTCSAACAGWKSSISDTYRRTFAAPAPRSAAEPQRSTTTACLWRRKTATGAAPQQTWSRSPLLPKASWLGFIFRCCCVTGASGTTSVLHLRPQGPLQAFCHKQVGLRVASSADPWCEKGRLSGICLLEGMLMQRVPLPK